MIPLCPSPLALLLFLPFLFFYFSCFPTFFLLSFALSLSLSPPPLFFYFLSFACLANDANERQPPREVAAHINTRTKPASFVIITYKYKQLFGQRSARIRDLCTEWQVDARVACFGFSVLSSAAFSFIEIPSSSGWIYGSKIPCIVWSSWIRQRSRKGNRISCRCYPVGVFNFLKHRMLLHIPRNKNTIAYISSILFIWDWTFFNSLHVSFWREESPICWKIPPG